MRSVYANLYRLDYFVQFFVSGKSGEGTRY